MKFPEYQTLFVNCDCGDLMHLAKFEYADDETDFGIELSVMLPQERPWWKRLWVGIRYILNIRGANDWHYTCVVMQHDMVGTVQAFMDQYQADRSAYWDHHEGKTDAYVPLRQFSRPGQGF